MGIKSVTNKVWLKKLILWFDSLEIKIGLALMMQCCLKSLLIVYQHFTTAQIRDI